MRNLVLRERRLLQLAPVDLAGQTLFHCVNEEAGCVYCLGENLVLSAHRLSDGKVEASLSLEPELVEPPVSGSPLPSPTSLLWSPDLGAVLVTLTTGELIAVHSLDEGTPVASSPGAVQGGILAAAWSPDGQLLSIVSGSAQVLLMNADWAVLSESPIPGAAGGNSSPLSKAAVSWRGDGAAFATVFGSSDASRPSSLCVWDRDGGAESVAPGETVPGLLPVLSYQPNGRHIYAASAHAAAPSASEPAAEPAAAPEVPAEEQQRRVSAWRFEERRKAAAEEAEAAESEAQWGSGALAGRVTLFERNGLTHGCFAVPQSAAGAEKDADEITHMAWSPDSSLLAIVVLRGSWSTVQCWTRSNWHWYLKLELPMREKVASLSWRDLGLALDCSTTSGTLLTATLGWTVCSSRWGSVAVVDGRWLRAHQLAWQVLPPPLCAGSLRLGATPLGACWLEQEKDGGVRCASSLPCERLALLMPDASLLLVSCRRSADDGECEEDVLLNVVIRIGPEWMGEIDLDSLGQFATYPPGALVFVASLSPNVLGVGLAGTLGGARLALLGLSLDEAFESSLETQTEAFEALVEDLVPRWVELAPLSEPVLSCGRGIVQTVSGKLHAQQDRDSASLAELDASAAFPSPCPDMQPTPLASLPPALGLSDRGVLAWGSQVLAHGVTSFAVRWRGPGGPYLLFTNRDHAMVSVPLSAELLARRAPGSSPGALPCASSRNVEHGALLVAAAGGSLRWDRATYQTPRGNLETVALRALVLESLAALLEGGRVAAAMKAAAQHAVDLNFVADLAWPRFLGQARRCVDQCDPEALADFVAALSEQSCVAEGGEYAWAPCAKRGSARGAPEDPAPGREPADGPEGAP
ncbi:IKI3 family protein, partial [Helicosporidium sp. ATCC 50920]